MLVRILRPLVLGLLALGSAGVASADDLDRFVQTHVDRRQIPGLSLAIIRDGRIVDTRTYGTTARNGKAAVTSSTLFQAGLICCRAICDASWKICEVAAKRAIGVLGNWPCNHNNRVFERIETRVSRSMAPRP